MPGGGHRPADFSPLPVAYIRHPALPQDRGAVSGLEVLGHRQIGTTEIYARVSDDALRLTVGGSEQSGLVKEMIKTIGFTTPSISSDTFAFPLPGDVQEALYHQFQMDAQ